MILVNELKVVERMAVYRITRFASADMDKAREMTENMRDKLEGTGADYIDIVSYGNGKGVVIAKYPDQATMESASDTANKAFADMIEAGVIDGDSIHPHTGEVLNSF
jgi:predicted aldo/keto reductase-like oxidoreductase